MPIMPSSRPISEAPCSAVLGLVSFYPVPVTLLIVIISCCITSLYLSFAPRRLTIE